MTNRLASNRYGQYCVPMSSQQRPAAQAIIQGLIWEPHTISFVRANVGSGDIVHAGTYFGDFIPAYSRALSTGAVLWAYEPNSENFQCAQATIVLNSIRNVVIRHAALSSGSRRAMLQIECAEGTPLGGGSTVTASKRSGLIEMVDTLSIDESVSPGRSVSIVQLDVEGHEYEALRGGIETIRRCHPIVIVESGVGADDWKAHDFLRGLGYRSAGCIHENRVFIPSETTDN